MFPDSPVFPESPVLPELPVSPVPPITPGSPELPDMNVGGVVSEFPDELHAAKAMGVARSTQATSSLSFLMASPSVRVSARGQT